MEVLGVWIFFIRSSLDFCCKISSPSLNFCIRSFIRRIIKMLLLSIIYLSSQFIDLCQGSKFLSAPYFKGFFNWLEFRYKLEHWSSLNINAPGFLNHLIKISTIWPSCKVPELRGVVSYHGDGVDWRDMITGTRLNRIKNISRDKSQKHSSQTRNRLTTLFLLLSYCSWNPATLIIFMI